MVSLRFNGSTVREPWLWGHQPQTHHAAHRLQWVHGPRTVVMHIISGKLTTRLKLQWVHGPRTVVMKIMATSSLVLLCPSFNGSTVREPWLCSQERMYLSASMRCFNGSTVREPWLCSVSLLLTCKFTRPGFNGSTVREPWLCRDQRCRQTADTSLQWVHGPRTVVMATLPTAGSGIVTLLQWVHGPRTVVMAPSVDLGCMSQVRLQWVHGPRTVVMHVSPASRPERPTG